MSAIFIATGKIILSRKTKGTMISLLIKEPLVIAHKTGSSLDETKPVAFSALTAKSSPNIPAVFFVAILLATTTSSIKNAISSKTAKNPDAILIKCRRPKVLKNVIF